MAASADGSDDGVTVLGRTVRCVGEFDTSNCAQLRAAFAEAAGAGPGYAIDLTATTFLDSSALFTLFEAAPGRPVVLVRAGSLMERLSATIGLANAVEVRPVQA